MRSLSTTTQNSPRKATKTRCRPPQKKKGFSEHVCVYKCIIVYHTRFHVYGDLCACGRRYLCLSVCICANMVWYSHLSRKDHLTCLLRNLFAGQEARVRTLYGTTDWFKIEKGVCQGCPPSSCLFNLHAEHIMRNAGLDEFQAGVKIGGRNINFRCAGDTTLKAENKEESLYES